MFWLAYRQLKQDLGRSALSCLGIAAIVATVLVFEGFEEGQYAQLRAVSRERGADLIATQAGVANMVAACSVIPQMVRADLEAVPGIRTAHPMTGFPLTHEGEGRRSAIFLYVYDTRGGRLWRWSKVAGSAGSARS